MAVVTVSCELLSPENTLINGKIQGKSFIHLPCSVQFTPLIRINQWLNATYKSAYEKLTGNDQGTYLSRCN
jgi:hypothetical protein